jgi:hypothetical protein
MAHCRQTTSLATSGALIRLPALPKKTAASDDEIAMPPLPTKRFSFRMFHAGLSSRSALSAFIGFTQLNFWCNWYEDISLRQAFRIPRRSHYQTSLTLLFWVLTQLLRALIASHWRIISTASAATLLAVSAEISINISSFSLLGTEHSRIE